MIILITGASHTGKTLLAQKLLEKYHYPYLSIDHLKMGLIRSGKTALTPVSRMLYSFWLEKGFCGRISQRYKILLPCYEREIYQRAF